MGFFGGWQGQALKQATGPPGLAVGGFVEALVI